MLFVLHKILTIETQAVTDCRDIFIIFKMLFSGSGQNNNGTILTAGQRLGEASRNVENIEFLLSLSHCPQKN